MDLESALVILPPKPVQAFAYPYREEFDPQSFSRLPAHIPLFYPFIEPTEIDAAEARLAAAVAAQARFEITLDRYVRTEQTISLEPTDAEQLQTLHQSLVEAFPDFASASAEFNPRLTLARLDSSTQADQIELPAEPSFSFWVEKLHLYVGSPQDVHAPYIPRSVIPLSGAA